MKLGAEKNRLLLLAVLVLVAVYFLFFNPSGDDHPPTAAVPAAARPQRQQPSAARDTSPPPADIRRTAVRAGSRLAVGGEFKPSLKPRRPEDRPDPATSDPTLHLDLLAKVQQVDVEAGGRSLFDFSTPPPPPKPAGAPEPKIHAKPSPLRPAGSSPGANSGPGVPLKPAPAPIPLKFYGYLSPVRQGGIKRAFFRSGDDIFVASEGDLVSKRYKVVRININSVVMEDMQLHHQQTLHLEEQPG